MIVRIIFWPFGGFLAAPLIIGIALLAVLVALYAANTATSPPS